MSHTAIGLTIAVYGLARFLVNYPSDRLSDRIGRKPTLAIGGTITVVGTLLGYVLGPLLLGATADLFSAEAALYATAVLLIGSGALFLLNAPETLPERALNPQAEPGG